MNDTQATVTPSVPSSDLYLRGIAVGIGIGVVVGASVALALTRPMGAVVRTLRARMHREIREPRFELLN